MNKLYVPDIFTNVYMHYKRHMHLSGASVGVWPGHMDSTAIEQPVKGERELRVNVLNAAGGLYLFRFWAKQGH
jgi:hypothetical protein